MAICMTQSIVIEFFMVIIKSFLFQHTGIRLAFVTDPAVGCGPKARCEKPEYGQVRMDRRQIQLLVCFLALLFTPLSIIRGQTTFGTVVGTVSDTSGAVVPAAQVTLTSMATSEKRSATTNDAGEYTFVNVLPGN